jgi:hypothetical protein
MSKYSFVLVPRKAASKPTERVFFNPEDYGAVKSQSRSFEKPLWLSFEPLRGLTDN